MKSLIIEKKHRLLFALFKQVLCNNVARVACVLWRCKLAVQWIIILKYLEKDTKKEMWKAHETCTYYLNSQWLWSYFISCIFVTQRTLTEMISIPLHVWAEMKKAFESSPVCAFNGKVVIKKTYVTWTGKRTCYIQSARKSM